MRKTKKILKTIIKEFETTPMVSVVCQKVGISRQTFYRWYQDDFDFKKNVDHAKEYGIEHMNDMAESQMIKKIQQGDTGMIKFSLKNNHPRYHTKERMKEEEKAYVFKPPKITFITPCGKNCEGNAKIIDVTKEDY